MNSLSKNIFIIIYQIRQMITAPDILVTQKRFWILLDTERSGVLIPYLVFLMQTKIKKNAEKSVKNLSVC